MTLLNRILDERFALERNHAARVTEIHCSPCVVRTIVMDADPMNALHFGSKVHGIEPPHVTGVDWFEDGHMSGETWRFVSVKS